jgi:dTDP-4-amino-4,6-dideoxygalactose transaminase
MFYLTCQNIQQRTEILDALKQNNIFAVFHYISLHSSPYYLEKHDGRVLQNTDNFTDTLLRLPLFYELDVQTVINHILE